MKKTISKAIIIIASLLLVTACASVPKFTRFKPIDNSGEKKEIAKRYLDFSDEVKDTITGVASYYAHDFHGKMTANGEIYDMYGLTAAHPSYPFETIIRVTNLRNKKVTIIRVNDRMPKREDRIIDLSLGTAEELGMIEEGITKVRLEILKWGEEKTDRQTSARQ